MTNNTFLEIRNIFKEFNENPVVNNISLDINRGEFLTILGPSGSGKTTLLNLIAGFLKKDKGQILLGNQDISQQKPYERNFGMVFQNYALFPHMNVFNNIAYPLRIRKLSKKDIEKKVNEILKLVGLEGYHSRVPNQLSGGQQQRVALARAIVFNPPLLLLDESLGALDKNLRQQMQLEVKRIQNEVGITTISVTHDQEEALTMSDRICLINDGVIQQVDTPERIYSKPKNNFVASFIGETNIIKGHVTSVVENENKIKISAFQNDTKVISTLDNKNIKVNNQVTVAIRPESINIKDEINHFDNVLEGIVLEKIYLGDMIKLNISLKESTISLKTSPRNTKGIQIDDKILIGWNATDTYVID